jgi:predicted RNA-binding Zn-ribbon protein involved in translation (DUF1610 family)
MVIQARLRQSCSNLNHNRPNPPVGHCPNCGGVSPSRPEPCNEASHAVARRRQTDFCVHCGEQLILRR